MGLLGKKETKSLEQLAREVIVANGIKIDPSFNDPKYISFNIVGIGTSEKNFQSAIDHFKKHLVDSSPAYVSEIKEDTWCYRPTGELRPRISAIGYTFKKPTAA